MYLPDIQGQIVLLWSQDLCATPRGQRHSVNIPVSDWTGQSPWPLALVPALLSFEPPPPSPYDPLSPSSPSTSTSTSRRRRNRSRVLLPWFPKERCLRVEGPTSGRHLISPTWTLPVVSSSCLARTKPSHIPPLLYLSPCHLATLLLL
jgi:hypothetical protein